VVLEIHVLPHGVITGLICSLELVWVHTGRET
jgi:hypothetical protein